MSRRAGSPAVFSPHPAERFPVLAHAAGRAAAPLPAFLYIGKAFSIFVLKKSFYGCSNYPECKFTLAEHFRKKKLTKTNVKELLEGKETLVKGIKNKEKKPYNAVVKIGEKGYIDFISFSK